MRSSLTRFSDEGLDLVEKVLKCWIEVQQPLPTDNNRWRPR